MTEKAARLRDLERLPEALRDAGLFEAVFSGEEPPEAVLAYLHGQPWERMGEAVVPRSVWSL